MYCDLTGDWLFAFAYYMATINETKEKMGVVKSVGSFANALQMIASMRMMALRDKVLASKRFVDEAALILKDLTYYKEMSFEQQYAEADRKSFQKKGRFLVGPQKDALIIISSNQGLCGKYNAEVFRRLESQALSDNKDSDIFIIGKKGQEHYFNNKKYPFKFYPYNLPDNFTATDLLRLVGIFSHYRKIIMLYSRYINTVTREVTESLLVTPPVLHTDKKDRGKDNVPFIFEPSIDELLKEVSSKLRAATFQQQILDSRLAQFSAQMVGMQSASENAKILLGDLQHEYNKQRRKLIDKKIAEVLGGSALW